MKIDKIKIYLPAFYWLPKLHKNPYKSRFISNSSHCSTTILYKHITSTLSADNGSCYKVPLAKIMWIIFGPSKALLRSSKSCGYETYRVLQYLLSIFLFYTHPCHMILHVSKQKCCLLLYGVSTENQKCTSVFQIRRAFLQQEIWLVYMLDLHWVMWSFYCPHGKYICAIWWHGIPTTTYKFNFLSKVGYWIGVFHAWFYS